jgi:hypothetical protein
VDLLPLGDRLHQADLRFNALRFHLVVPLHLQEACDPHHLHVACDPVSRLTVTVHMTVMTTLMKIITMRTIMIIRMIITR